MTQINLFMKQKQTHKKENRFAVVKGGGGGMEQDFGVSRFKLINTEQTNKGKGNYTHSPGTNSNGKEYEKECVSEWKSLSRVRLFVTPGTIQSMEFSRSEHWSGQPFPSPGDLPNPGIEPRSPALQADSLPAEPQGKTTRMYTYMFN